MKVTGLIFILSFLAFKWVLGENSCITTYQSNVYLVEATHSSTSIKSFQPSSAPKNNNTTNTSNSNSNNDTFIPWQNASETQQGAVSLFSCTTVHHYLFLLISPTIPIEQQQPNDGENVKSILTFDYQSHQWRSIPLYLDPPASTLVVSSWNTRYVAYNTVTHITYYFDTQLWSWHSNDDQNGAQSPPSLSITSDTSTITTAEMATVNSSLYYFFNDESDHYLNHIYAFDLTTQRWNGHFASFWSNRSSFYFSSDDINTLYAIPRLKNDNDRFMRTIHVNSTSALIVQTPTVELQANDAIASTVGGDLVVYNGTRLMIYQPATNTISAIYGQVDQVLPDGNSTTSPPSSSFWSTSEGERIKIALGCSLSIGVVLVTVIGAILLRNRRQNHDRDHQYHAKERDLLSPARAPASVEETNQHADTTGTPAPTTRTTKLSTSMQSLSFLTRDNAMVWGKHVHQLLALITFRRQQEEEREAEEEVADDDGDYPSMIKTSTTVSALAMSSMILSMISSSISATNNNNAFLTPPTPSTPMNRRSLDMTCPLPRNSLGQAESSSSPPPPPS